jgi:hypothetical protein
MPLIITAVRGISEPIMCLRNQAMSTSSQALFLLVNGPITKELNINSKCGAMGPNSASYANSVIGRAVSLIMMNVGHAYPGIMSMGSQGSPLKYSMCVAENDEDSPWEPFHVTKGYDKDISVLTLEWVYGMSSFQDFSNYTAENLARGLSTVAATATLANGMWITGRQGDPRHNAWAQEHQLVLLCPEHAQVFARNGWKRQELQQYLYDHARLTVEEVMLTKTPESLKKTRPELVWLLDHPELYIPIVETPDCFNVAVVGSAGGTSFYFEGAREYFSLPVKDE